MDQRLAKRKWERRSNEPCDTASSLLRECTFALVDEPYRLVLLLLSMTVFVHQRVRSELIDL